MHCPHCGAETPAGSALCPSCRQRIATPSAPTVRVPPPLPPGAQPTRRIDPPVAGPDTVLLGAPLPDHHRRPLIVTLMAGFSACGAVFLLAGAAIAARVVAPGNGIAHGAVAGGALLGVLGLWAGLGLWRLRPWGRRLAIVEAVLTLLLVPAGTIAGYLALVYLLKPGVRRLFSGLGPGELRPEDLAAINGADAERSLAGLTMGFAVAATLTLVVLAGIESGIAIPLVLRARAAADESQAVEQLRAVSLAEEQYRSASGHYDTIDCLTAPGSCIPGYSKAGPAFLDGARALDEGAERQGFRFRLHAGPPLPRERLNAEHASPTGMVAYAYTAEPAAPGRRPARSFCVDGVGQICAAPGALMHVDDGECPAACVPLARSSSR